MLLCRSSGYNLDLQVLLRNLGAHNLALQLLQLPIADEEKPDELQPRAVLRAAYRLIKALASGYAQLQAELVSAIPTFVAHVEKKRAAPLPLLGSRRALSAPPFHARLIAHDISPTGTISAVLKNNRAACALVSVETIRHFVRLAAREHAPRFLRFLAMITSPTGTPIRRNQLLITQALTDNSAALVLYDGAAGRAERAVLLEARHTAAALRSRPTRSLYASALPSRRPTT